MKPDVISKTRDLFSLYKNIIYEKYWLSIKQKTL